MTDFNRLLLLLHIFYIYIHSDRTAMQAQSRHLRLTSTLLLLRDLTLSINNALFIIMITLKLLKFAAANTVTEYSNDESTDNLRYILDAGKQKAVDVGHYSDSVALMISLAFQVVVN
uniref:Secreted protein n=1 Tax=Syphacia muris TaxID=451379 RepID=A0A0N5AS08_9BILA